MSTHATRGYTVKGWHVLAAMLAFFGAVIAINVAFAVAAISTFPGEDVRHSYTQGLDYNNTMAEREAQALNGWRASVALQHAAGGAALEVALRTRDGRPLDGARLDGVLRWPTDSHLDRPLQFTPLGGGRYRAPLGALRDGRWRLRAHAGDASGGALDFEADVTWRASH